ncbi:hypothetical protein GOP47_0011556 [Adiantum capillus-veneris]|uniref:NADP-dependent oxidoreductase domain-containing protein n=1 Tax=Adiantum capillus-veneris TaxID=13818 RepID=A0A9D4UT06_ADICA|nr:hypothetical protein GOP47_0011556 [Adiantum capillus-veneris]
MTELVALPRRPIGTLQVPAITIGLWQVAGGHGKINLEKAVQEMKVYAEAGFFAFDLADIYGPSEDLYGRFMKEKNDGVCSYGFTKLVPRPGPMTKHLVEMSINGSMQKMGVSSLDMVQFHWWDYEDERYLDAVKALAELKEEGKIVEVALTNFDTYHMNKILSSGCPIVSNQVAYSIIDTRPEKKMVPWCLQNNIKLLAYGTLLGGFLAEKYIGKIEPKRYELNTSSLAKYKYVIDQWGSWRLFQELLLVLKGIADKYGVSISNIAMRYIADKPVVGSVVVGARLSIAEHIADNALTFSFPGLDASDLSMIHAVVHKGKPLVGDCGDEYRMGRR